MEKILHFTTAEARNQLGTLGGVKSVPKGVQFFKLCPIVLNYVQHIFPGGLKFSRGASPLLVTGLLLRISVKLVFQVW